MEADTTDILGLDMEALTLQKQEFIQHFNAKPGLIKQCINNNDSVQIVEGSVG